MKNIFRILSLIALIIGQSTFAQTVVRWTDIYGGSSSDAIQEIQQTTDGGYVMVGYTFSSGNGSADVWLIKLDENYNELWSATFGSSRDDRGMSVKQTSDDGFIVVGHSKVNGAYSDVYLIKTDSTGSEEWSHVWERIRSEEAHSIQITSEGQYIIGGRTASLGNGGADAFLMKTDTLGNQVWFRTFGGANHDYAYSIKITPSGKILIGGATTSFGSGGLDAWLIMTDNEGNQVWSQTYGGSAIDLCYSVDLSGTNGGVFTGCTQSFGSGNSDTWLVRIDSLGNELWNRTFESGGEDSGYDVKTLPGDEGFVIVGKANGGAASWFIRTDILGNLILEQMLSPMWANSSCFTNTPNEYLVAGYSGGYSGYLSLITPHKTWHVSAVGSNNNLGTSNFPFASIQHAIDETQDGDTVLVQPGTYVENINFNGKNIVVGSLFLTSEDTSYITQTVIDGNESGSVVTFNSGENETAEIVGFNIINGLNTNGGGVHCYQSSPTLNQLTITDCSATGSAAGVYLEHSNSEVSNSKIFNNSGSNSGGVLCWDGSPTLSNLLIYDNSGSEGSGIKVSIGNVLVLNSTIVSNETNGIWVGGGADLTVLNSIVSNNGNQALDQIVNGGATRNISYSLIEGGYDGYGNIGANPIFNGMNINDFTLSNYSQCIGAGLDTTISVGEDIDGNPRPSPTGSNPDIGAYENPFGIPQHMPITINVPGDYATIQAAIDVAESTDTVLVEPGIYTENIAFPATNNLRLISLYGPETTIIDGDASGSVMIFNNTGSLDSSTIIQGFTLRNGGNVIRGGGIALQVDSPKFLNCIITGNVATSQGGGVYAYQSDAVFESCQILNNNAFSEGGGVYAEDCGLSIRDSEINTNQAHSDGGYTGGGGLRLQSSHISLSNVTISGNSTNNQGGGIFSSFVYNNPSSTFNNVKIIGNSAHDGGGIALNNDSPIITNSSIIGNTALENAGGIGFYYETTAPVLENVIIAMNSAMNGGGFIAVQLAAPSLENVLLAKNNATGQGGAAYYIGYAEGEMRNVTLEGNTAGSYPGIYSTDFSYPSVSQSNFINNINALHNNDNLVTIDADSCWWGDLTGPNHSGSNPSGLGESVVGTVDVQPWLLTPDMVAPPISPQNVTVLGTGNDFVSLSWDSSPLGDFEGFKLYYDTDEGGYPYSQSIDIGTDTSYTLSGLNLGTEYFLAVTAYDTDGNESWYSTEVTGTTRVMEVQSLDLAGDEDLQHITTHDPLITFNYFDSMGEPQTAYQIQISTDSTFQGGDIWDTGVVTSDATSVLYNSEMLENGIAYHLRAKVASGAFWSEWATLSFRLNTEPSSPGMLSPENGEVVTTQPTLKFLKSNDAEEDALMYSVYLYNTEEMLSPLDSLINYTSMTDTISWTVSVALDDNAQHWWKVKANDGYEYNTLTELRTFLFNISNDAPAVFTLISPVENVEVTSLNPILTWHLSDDLDPLDTVSYVLYLDTPDPGVEAFTIGADTSYQVVTTLLDNTTYSWKVIASDLNGASTENTGGYQSFRVNTTNDLPTAFNLLAPEDGAMLVDLTPTLMWEPSSDPDDGVLANREVQPIRTGPVRSTNSSREITAYQVYLDTDSLFTETSPVEVFGAEYTPDINLSENMIYYWKIEAVDDDGGTLFSDRYSFWTNAENEAPTEFGQLLPEVDEVLTVLSPTFTWSSSSDPDLQDGFDYNLVLWTDPGSMDTIWTGPDTTLLLDWELEDNQTYYWTVYAEDWSGLVTANEGGYQSFSVNTANDLPVAFELLYPVYDEMVTNLQPEFLWEASSDPDDVTLALRESGKGKFTENTSSGNNSITVITGYEFYLGTDVELTDVVAVEVIGTSYSPAEDLMENQVYYWAVSAVDDSGGVTFSDTTSFWTNAENEVPSAFEMIQPWGVAYAYPTLQSLQPQFSWTSASDPDLHDEITYHLLLGYNIEDMSEVYTGTDTTWLATEDLYDNFIYYWRIIATDQAGASTEPVHVDYPEEGMLSVFAINLENDPPNGFAAITPTRNSVEVTLTPEFYWEASVDPDPVLFNTVSYYLFVDTDSLFAETIPIFSNENSYEFETGGLFDNSEYYWKVVASDDQGASTESERVRFWVNTVLEPPLDFSLLSPQDDVSGLSQTVAFEWEPTSDNDPNDFATYDLVVALDSNFTDVITTIEGLSDLTWQNTDDLLLDTEYWWKVIAVDTDSLSTETETFKFTVGYVSIADGVELPIEYALKQNYPNPFNPSTTIKYGLPEDSNVSLVIYDLRGNVVQTLESGSKSAGWYELAWNGQANDGRSISTGLYFTRIVAGDYSQVVKMLYLK